MSVAMIEVENGGPDHYLAKTLQFVEQEAFRQEADDLAAALSDYLSQQVGAVGLAAEIESAESVMISPETNTEGVTLSREINPLYEQDIQRMMRAMRLGEAALKREVDGSIGEYQTMKMMLIAAMNGDERAMMGAMANIEIMFKEATSPCQSVMHSEATVEPDGLIWQYGQSSASIVSNTLRHGATIGGIGEVESQIFLRTGMMVTGGEFGVGDIQVESCLIPPGQRAELEKLGYLLGPMSMIIRMTELMPDGKTLKIESHFVAGADFKGIERQMGKGMATEEIVARQHRAMETRFDTTVVRRHLANVTGRELPKEAGAVEVLNETYLIKASDRDSRDVKLGVVKDIDLLIGQILGTETVYGVPNSELTHEQIMEASYFESQRVRDMSMNVFNEVAKLLHWNPMLDPGQIPGLLAHFAKREMVNEVVFHGADPIILGSGGAPHGAAARQDVLNGGNGGNHIIEAVKNSTLGGCPTRKDPRLGGESQAPQDEDPGICIEVKDGDTVRCPGCEKIVKAMVPVKGGEIFCSNPKCKFVAPNVAAKAAADAATRQATAQKTTASKAKATQLDNPDSAKYTGRLKPKKELK